MTTPYVLIWNCPHLENILILYLQLYDKWHTISMLLQYQLQLNSAHHSYHYFIIFWSFGSLYLFKTTIIILLRKVSFGWIKHTNTNFIENNQKVIYFWRFDLYQRPSSEEAGTRSSSSGSRRNKLESSQESGHTYDLSLFGRHFRSTCGPNRFLC